MERIPQCNGCPSDGRCQYQDVGDCQSCEQTTDSLKAKVEAADHECVGELPF